MSMYGSPGERPFHRLKQGAVARTERAGMVYQDLYGNTTTQNCVVFLFVGVRIFNVDRI